MAEVGSEALYLPWKKEKPRPRQGVSHADVQTLDEVRTAPGLRFPGLLEGFAGPIREFGVEIGRDGLRCLRRL